MSYTDLWLGIGLLALESILAYFAVDGFRLWRKERKERRERRWQEELAQMALYKDDLIKRNQRMIDEAYRHSLPPDHEAVLRAERMTKAAALEPQGNTLYGWTAPRPGDPGISNRARVERRQERRRADDDSYAAFHSPPFTAQPPAPEQQYSPASAFSASPAPSVSGGGGSFDGGGSSASYGSSCSSSSSSDSGGSSSSSCGSD